MIPEEGFLHEIRRDPDDFTHYLIFADWLEEHGPVERAELIRIQCQTGCMVKRDAERIALQRRARRLVRTHAEQWHGSVPEFRMRWSQGLLSVFGELRQLQYNEPRAWWVANQPWILKATLDVDYQSEFLDAVNAGWLSQLSSLKQITGNISRKSLEAMTALPDLRKFEIGVNTETDLTGDQHLQLLGNLTGLQSLISGGYGINPNALIWLKHLHDLRTLRVSLNMSNANASLEPISRLKSLQDLTLSLNGRWKKQEVERLTELPRLKSLYFYNGADPASGLRYLSGSDSLRTLRITHILISRATLRAIGQLTQLEHLEICPSDRVGDDWLRYLTPLTNLRSLDLSRSDYVRERGLEHLEELPELETLNLDYARINQSAIKSLAHVTRLKHLFLSHSLFDGSGLKYLVDHEHLVSLDLSSSMVDDLAVPYLLALPQLRWINLRGTHFSAKCLRTLREGLPEAIIVR